MQKDVSKLCLTCITNNKQNNSSTAAPNSVNICFSPQLLCMRVQHSTCIPLLLINYGINTKILSLQKKVITRRFAPVTIDANTGSWSLMTTLALASFKSNLLILHEIETDEKLYGYACNMTYMADYCKTSRMQEMQNSFKFFKFSAMR